MAQKHRGSLEVTKDLTVDNDVIVVGAVVTSGVRNLPFSDSLFIPFPGSGIDGTGDGSQDVDYTLGFDMTIDEAVVATTAGSLTYSVLIDDVIVEGLDNQSVTTSEATDTATSANEYFKGSVITVAISGASNAQGFRFTLNSTRNS